MQSSRLAATAADSRRLYAVSAAPDDGILAALRSDDGGSNWTTATTPQNPGNQGFYNQAIAASPFNRDLVALAWRNSTYISQDAGTSWLPINDPHGHLHGDFHALYFPQ